MGRLPTIISETRQHKERHCVVYKEEFDAVANIKKLTIIELEKLLNEVITPKGYIRLVLAQPEFGKQLIVGFTVQDGDPARKGYNKRTCLQKGC